MRINLTVSAPDLDVRQIQSISGDLTHQIAREIPAVPVEHIPGAGERGAIPAFGSMIIDIVKDKAEYLLSVLGAFLARRSTLVIELEHGANKIALRASDLNGEQFDHTLQLVKKMIEDDAS